MLKHDVVRGAVPITNVTVCVCTMKRLGELARLLEALLDQDVTDDFRFSVVVVDNDVARTARSIVDEYLDRRGDVEVEYVVEPVASISRARNRALDAVSGDAVAFIDDDERPVKGWLKRLVATLNANGADMVVGPVVPAFEPGTANWIVRSKVFDRDRYRSGMEIGYRDARTGNVLIRRSAIEPANGSLRFDEELGSTGGEDSLFFQRLLRRGAKALWCDEAEVYERIPLSRASVAYLVKRWFQAGISSALIAKKMRGMHAAYLEAAKGVLLVTCGSALGIVLTPISLTRAALWMRKAVSGAGKIAFLFGCRFGLYAPNQGIRKAIDA